jgi:hypothetical protein
VAWAARDRQPDVAWDEKNDTMGFSNHPESAIMNAFRRGEPSMSLKTMTVSKLKELKHQVEAAIHTKVTERRHEIESELSKLARFDGGRGVKVVRAGAKEIVAVKVGKKLDEPLMANSPKASTPKQPKKKTRRAANNAPAGVSILASADRVEPLPIETPPVASIDANVIPADLSAAA